MYLEDIGFMPETLNDMLRVAYNTYHNAGGSGTYEEWVISNMGTIFERYYLPIAIRQQTLMAKSFNNIASAIIGMKLQINHGNGGAFRNFINTFLPICDGIYLDEPNRNTSLAPGEVGIYLDNALDFDNSGLVTEESLNKLRNAFNLCGSITNIKTNYSGLPDILIGNLYNIDVLFKNGQVFTWQIFNLIQSQYTAIDIRINVHYINNAVRYPDQQILTALTKAINEDFTIGQWFYVNRYLSALCRDNFLGIESLFMVWSTDGGTTWNDNIDYETKPWERLRLNSLVINSIS